MGSTGSMVSSIMMEINAGCFPITSPLRIEINLDTSITLTLETIELPLSQDYGSVSK